MRAFRQVEGPHRHRDHRALVLPTRASHLTFVVFSATDRADRTAVCHTAFSDGSRRRDSPYLAVFVPGGQGALPGIPSSEDVKRVLLCAMTNDKLLLEVGPDAVQADDHLFVRIAGDRIRP